jgi:hypothetical protein
MVNKRRGEEPGKIKPYKNGKKLIYKPKSEWFQELSREQAALSMTWDLHGVERGDGHGPDRFEVKDPIERAG